MSALTKFLAKNGADFLPPRAAALVEERIAALRAVREAVKSKTGYIRNGGAEAYVQGVGDKVVKSTKGSPDGDWMQQKDFKINHKGFKRRGFLESILADQGAAPRTMLVETSKNKYMVQPRFDDFPILDEKSPDLAKWAHEVTGKAGMTAHDLNFHNIGHFKNKPGIFDTGSENLTRAMTPAERKSALEKFISKGKRKKPWLDE